MIANARETSLAETAVWIGLPHVRNDFCSFSWNAPDPGQGDAHPGRSNLDYAGN